MIKPVMPNITYICYTKPQKPYLSAGDLFSTKPIAVFLI